MSKVILGGKLLVFLYMLSLVYFLMTDYGTPVGRVHMPFVLVVIDWINLFIHEGGHGVFQIFGQFINALGGSLMQVLLPGAAVWVFLRSGWGTLPFTLFWLGENVINVSVYIMDAPYRRLPLISKYATHDWGYITDTLGVTHLAEDFGLGVKILGILMCLGALGFGFYLVAQRVRQEFFADRPGPGPGVDRHMNPPGSGEARHLPPSR